MRPSESSTRDSSDDSGIGVQQTNSTTSGSEETRRTFVRGVAALSATGALGSMAGCTGDSENGSGGGGGASGDNSGGTDSGSGGGSQESITIEYWSQEAAETPTTTEYFNKSFKNFQQQHENISVDLNAVSSSDIRDQLIPAVQSGNPPDAAQAGSVAKTWFDSGRVIDHSSYIEESDDLPDAWSAAHVEATQFRDGFWAAGSNKMPATISVAVPQLFKDAGVTDPSQLETWTGWRRAVEKVKQEHDNVWAFEETGDPGDLESYWGEARTAYKNGVDPWMEGSVDDLTLKVGQQAKTDGMIKNLIDLTEAYSSPKSPSRTNEAMPPLLVNQKAASFHYGQGRASDYRRVNDNVEFGWDGDIYGFPIPKLDPNYGAEFDIPELEGVEGERGGHVWTLEPQKSVFADSDNQDAAWEVCNYTNTNKEHIVPFLSKINTAPPTYMPFFEDIKASLKDEYDGEVPQIFDAVLTAFNEYDKNFKTTGAGWPVFGVSQLRWTDLNETISQGMAGQIPRDELPSRIRSKMTETLKNNNDNVTIN